ATATDAAGNVSPSSAAATTVIPTAVTPTSLGTATDTSTAQTLALSNVSVAAGRTIFVTVAMDASSSPQTVTVSDSAGNTYTKDADVNNYGVVVDKNNNVLTTGVRTV